jgi:hypothetical protein
MKSENVAVSRRVPWNKGKLTGQKPPLKLREIWAIRTRLQMASNVRELAMFNLAIDSKLRACDLTRLQMQDVRHGSHVAASAAVTPGSEIENPPPSVLALRSRLRGSHESVRTPCAAQKLR